MRINSWIHGFLIIVPTFFYNLAGCDASLTDFYGNVHATTRDGFIRPLDPALKDNIRAIHVDGIGGALWSMDSAAFRLESSGSHGANLEVHAPGDWTLLEGTMEVTARSAVTVRMSGARIKIRGRAVLKNSDGLESMITVFDGKANVEIQNKTLTLHPLEALRMREGHEVSKEQVSPPPELVRPPEVLSAPVELTLQALDEQLSAGLLQVTCSTRRHFWENAKHFLFRPGEPVVLTELPAGTVFLRAAAVARNGLAGPPGHAFRTTVIDEPPRLAERPFLQTGVVRGQMDPPIGRVDITWDNLRTTTDPRGKFEFRPDHPFGMTFSDLCMDPGPGAMKGCESLFYLSDPDSMAYFLPAAGDRNWTLYIRATAIPFRNTAKHVQVMLDGIPLTVPETNILAPTAIQRTLEFTTQDTTYRLSILRDAEGPKILNVTLESRGGAERFYVLADILDLGIGLSLPAKAVFENDVGEKLNVALARTSDFRLEGSAVTGTPQRKRARVWWVRVEADDLLGNRSLFEKAVYHKRHRKFLDVGLKDLVKIWKNRS